MKRLWHRLRRRVPALSAPRLLALAFVAGALWVGVRALAWWVPLPERLGATPSTVVSWADGSPAFVFLSEDDKVRMAVDPERLDGPEPEIDPAYLQALLRFEDKRFYRHPGVDPIAVLRSAWVNLRHLSRLTGASTITMQLVRVLEPRPRTLASKFVEALRAMQLELRMDKDQILAAYLTFAPYGRNLEGVPAASWAFFGHGPAALDPLEIATLLAVPQRPARRHPSGENTAALRAARDEIAVWLASRRGLDIGPQGLEGLRRQLGAIGVPSRLRPLPRSAPHAAFWLRSRWESPSRPPSSPLAPLQRIPTTLDRGRQRLAERVLAGAAAGLARRGIHNASAVVVDHRTGAVEALVGNPDFWDEEHGGQIPGFDVKRSPGSALKPFLYAQAIDRGLALPEMKVADVPMVFGDYRPANYDGDFAGLVTLDDALSRSLNVPFIRLLSRLGVEDFVDSLRGAGVDALADEPGYYGLSAALGSLEVTPLELAGLYAALARGGRYQPLQIEPPEDGDPQANAVELFSRGAAYLTRKSLRRRDRPDFPGRTALARTPPRDPLEDRHQLRSSRRLGRRLGPHGDRGRLAGQLRPRAGLRSRRGRRRRSAPLRSPRGRHRVSSCTAGRPPVRSHAGRGLRPTPAILRATPARNDIGPSPYGVAFRPSIARTTSPWRSISIPAAPSTPPAGPVAAGPVARSPSGRRASVVISKLANGELPSPPSLATGCRSAPRGEAPRIVHPPRGQTLVLLPGVPTDRQEIPLEADAPAAARLSWFVDGEYLGTVRPDERLWWEPGPGNVEVLVRDDVGRTARRTITVRNR